MVLSHILGTDKNCYINLIHVILVKKLYSLLLFTRDHISYFNLTIECFDLTILQFRYGPKPKSKRPMPETRDLYNMVVEKTFAHLTYINDLSEASLSMYNPISTKKIKLLKLTCAIGTTLCPSVRWSSTVHLRLHNRYTPLKILEDESLSIFDHAHIIEISFPKLFIFLTVLLLLMRTVMIR